MRCLRDSCGVGNHTSNACSTPPICCSRSRKTDASCNRTMRATLAYYGMTHHLRSQHVACSILSALSRHQNTDPPGKEPRTQPLLLIDKPSPYVGTRCSASNKKHSSFGVEIAASVPQSNLRIRLFVPNDCLHHPGRYIPYLPWRALSSHGSVAIVLHCARSVQNGKVKGSQNTE